VIEHSLAKYSDAEIVVYVGCGERGNEMAEVLHDFPSLTDARTGGSIMDRTVMVVNTSNMPVAAREASVYLGVTIAEFYRDMGYQVALLIDSLSRWAEALRELGGRLAEMPGEEGYPTYLASRMGQFYERAGRARALGAPDREGSLTIIAAVSPPGGDFSEPVTQATLRVAGTLWALDARLADLLSELESRTSANWGELRAQTLALLQEGRNLRDIAGLVGPEALQDKDRLVLEIARLLQDVVLGQSAFDPNDACSPLSRTHRLAELVIEAYRRGRDALAEGVRFEQLDLEPVQRGLGELLRAPPAEQEARAAAVAARIETIGLPRAA
jgi:V/A-type H+-transporting ATPase subunit A